MTEVNENNITINLLRELDNVSRFFKTEKNISSNTIPRLFTAEFLEENNKLNKQNVPINIERVEEIKNKRLLELERRNKNLLQNEKFNKRTKSLNIISQKGEQLMKDIYYLFDDVKKETNTNSFNSELNTIIKTNQSSNNFMGTLGNEDVIPIDTKKRKFIEKFDNLIKVRVDS